MRPALCHTGRTDQGRRVKWVEIPGELVTLVLCRSGGSDTGRLSHWILTAAGSPSSPPPPASDRQTTAAFTQTGNIERCAAALSVAWLLVPYLPKVGRAGGRRRRILRLFVNSRYTHVKRDLADSFSVFAAKTVFRSMLIFSIE